MRLAKWAGLVASDVAGRCYSALPADAPSDYRELAALVAAGWIDSAPAASASRHLVGLSGGQGTGKSTLAELLEIAGREIGCRVVSVSIDDFYLTRDERLELAARAHPLFETRGPPGTHDVDLLLSCLASLRRNSTTQIPSFDKGRDDRVGVRELSGPGDVIVLEGWCVGAQSGAVESLESPLNDLERLEDPDGTWRRAVNDFLAGAYQDVWRQLDETIFLSAPSMAAIRRWRLEQEDDRLPSERWDESRIEGFVQYYERWTMEMSAGARTVGAPDWQIELDETHRVSGVTLRRNGAGS